MRLLRYLCVACAAGLLTLACGGGGGNAPASAPSPAPVSTPTPTPTPTPSPAPTAAPPVSGAYAVAKYGALKVSGNRIVGKDGNPVQLKGMSLFWSCWGGKFWNAEAVNDVAEYWHADIVRAAMSAAPNTGGYLDAASKDSTVAQVKTVVDAAIAKGIYVIIDWHEEQAIYHQAEAVAFFTQMAQTYGSQPNVIFEIYNEPNKDNNGATIQWPAIKTYAQAVIAAIRGTGSTNLVVVGTPNWSQDVDVAAADPLSDSNVAYVLHFYSGTHRQWLRDKATTALNKNVALFVSEWGCSNSSGVAGVDLAEADLWMAFLDQNQLSWCNWSLNDKDEACSAFVPGTAGTGPWSMTSLTTSGGYVYQKLTRVTPASASTPGSRATLP